MRRFLLLLLAIMWVPLVWAADPATSQASDPAAVAPGTLISLANRPVVTLRATLSSITAPVRAQRAQALLESLPEQELGLPITRLHLIMSDQPVTVFELGDRLLFWLTPQDQDPTDHRPFDTWVSSTEANLRTALVARQEGLHWPNLIHGAVMTAVACAVLVLAVWVLGLARRRVLGWLTRLRDQHLQTKGVDWIEMLLNWGIKIIHGLAALAVLALAYVWLLFVLEQFTFTQPLGDRMGLFLSGLLMHIAEGFVNAIPGVITVVVVLLITRALHLLVIRIFDAVQQGRMEIPGLHPDTAGATRRMVSVMVWALGLTFAYPYIPGSQSDVFKGLSVLFGFMITLGSAGIVNQLMSGMVLIYSRALRRGDLVAIGETTGVVTELSTLSVKLMTLRKEEITIPNAVVVGNTIHNYTRQAGAAGSLVSTTVTIGYDTPWRQVHAMLVAAASKTPGLALEPAPYVLQRSLSDFYVEYQLFAHLPDPMERAGVLSGLHGMIQDEFNIHGVQIMSPHFEEQPQSRCNGAESGLVYPSCNTPG